MITYASGVFALDKGGDCRKDGQRHYKVCEDGPDPYFGRPGHAEYG